MFLSLLLLFHVGPVYGGALATQRVATANVLASLPKPPASVSPYLFLSLSFLQDTAK